MPGVGVSRCVGVCVLVGVIKLAVLIPDAGIVVCCDCPGVWVMCCVDCVGVGSRGQSSGTAPYSCRRSRR